MSFDVYHRPPRSIRGAASWDLLDTVDAATGAEAIFKAIERSRGRVLHGAFVAYDTADATQIEITEGPL